jgi:hypothetical protein
VGRLLVVDGNFRDHEKEPAIFEVLVAAAGLTEQIGPCLLKVNEIIRMMQQPHAIGFGIADADFGFTCQHDVIDLRIADRIEIARQRVVAECPSEHKHL